MQPQRAIEEAIMAEFKTPASQTPESLARRLSATKANALVAMGDRMCARNRRGGITLARRFGGTFLVTSETLLSLEADRLIGRIRNNAYVIRTKLGNSVVDVFRAREEELRLAQMTGSSLERASA
jgi:hypothetical protein